MWSRHPRPWHHAIDLAPFFAGIAVFYKAPVNDWDVVFIGGGLIALGVGSFWATDMGMVADKSIERIMARGVSVGVDEIQKKRDAEAKELAKSWDGLRPLNRNLIPQVVTNAQVVEMPKINYQQHFFTCVLRSYDLDPVYQSKVNLSEGLWVKQRKMFSQKPFAEMKRRAAAAGAFKRKDKRKNSEFIVASREQVEWLAAGNTLPEASPPPPF